MDESDSQLHFHMKTPSPERESKEIINTKIVKLSLMPTCIPFKIIVSAHGVKTDRMSQKALLRQRVFGAEPIPGFQIQRQQF